jgi:hypothetical protein
LLRAWRLFFAGRVGTGFSPKSFGDPVSWLPEIKRPLRAFVNLPMATVQTIRWSAVGLRQIVGQVLIYLGGFGLLAARLGWHLGDADGQNTIPGAPSEVMHQHALLPVEKLKNVPGPVVALLEALLEKDPARRF